MCVIGVCVHLSQASKVTNGLKTTVTVVKRIGLDGK